MKKAIFSVEGNIGSGKSTLLAIIDKMLPHVKIIPQPVQQWQNISSKYNLLDEYYKDPHRWAFTFQANAVLSRMTQLTKLMNLIQADPQSIFFTERSVQADKQIFAKLLHNQSKMNQMEYKLYLNMFHSLDALFKTPRFHKYIYLRSNPQMCYQRMIKRNRHEEQAIPLDYFKQIHQLHEGWLARSDNVLIIDGDKEFETDEKRATEIIQHISKFF